MPGEHDERNCRGRRNPSPPPASSAMYMTPNKGPPSRVPWCAGKVIRPSAIRPSTRPMTGPGPPMTCTIIYTTEIPSTTTASGSIPPSITRTMTTPSGTASRWSTAMETRTCLSSDRLFNRFTIAIDVIGHELTHGVTEFSANLAYWQQSGWSTIPLRCVRLTGQTIQQQTDRQPRQIGSSVRDTHIQCPGRRTCAR